MQLRLFPATLLLLAACAPARKPAGPAQARFSATDFAFNGPDSIAPGMTAIRMVNEGAQEHHLILGRLADGKTVHDLMAFAQQNPTAEPPFLTWRGAANAVSAGDSTGATVDLAPGRYILICFIPDPADNVPHVNKGMVKELVVAGPPNEAPAPTVEGAIRMSDFAYTVPPLTAGTNTLHMVNDGPQTHEAQLVRLNDGVTAQQFLAGLAPGAAAPPPGRMVGGSGALSPGFDNYWTVNLTPGTYVLTCFVPDSADGRPHVMKGMMRELVIAGS